jgi:hypothetical protein
MIESRGQAGHAGGEFPFSFGGQRYERNSVLLSEVLQLFDFAEKPLASAILQKSRSLIVRHLGKAVFEQNRDFSEESNLCNTSLSSVLVAPFRSSCN